MKYLIACVILIISTTSYSSNYHIQPNGSDNNDGSSFAKAFKTIQKATNLAVAGDSILVYDGFYKGWDHFYKNSGTKDKPIVYFAKGKNVVINQSCGRGYDGLNIEGNDYIEVNGFKVQSIADANGSGEDGIRAVLANHITVRNCTVDSCYRGIFTGYTDDFLAEYNVCRRSYGEHGIYVSNNSDRVIVRHNVCYNNKAAGIQLNPDLSSGAPGLSYEVRIYNNICYGNRIGLNLQGLYYSWVYNNLLYNNGSNNGGNGITLFHGDAATGCNDVKVFNNTVIVPSGSQWAILAIEGDSLWVVNNILVSFSPKGSLDIESTCTNYTGQNNILSNRMTINQGSSYIDFRQWQALGYDLNSSIIQNIEDLFVDLPNNNYHLRPTSIARDKGSNEIDKFIKMDLDNNLRWQGSNIDIGCYEFNVPTNTKDVNENSNNIIQHSNKVLFLNISEPDIIIKLYDLTGREMAKGKTIQTHDFNTGLYIVKAIQLNKILQTEKVFIAN